MESRARITRAMESVDRLILHFRGVRRSAGSEFRGLPMGVRVSAAREDRRDNKRQEHHAPKHGEPGESVGNRGQARLYNTRPAECNRASTGPVMTVPPVSSRGRNLALIAALLGWMFDGMEMGLFPLVGKDALARTARRVEAPTRPNVDKWFGVDPRRASWSGRRPAACCSAGSATRSAASGR